MGEVVFEVHVIAAEPEQVDDLFDIIAEAAHAHAEKLGLQVFCVGMSKPDEPEAA